MGILVFFLVVSFLMGTLVLLWDHTRLGGPARLDQYEQFLDRINRFGHLRRITARDDFEFLKTFPNSKDLLSRLRKERRIVLRLVLRDMREEFRALVAVAVMLAAAPTARHANFGVKMLLSTVQFNAMYYWLYLGTFWRPLRLAGVQADRLAKHMQDTRQGTRILLASLTTFDMGFLREEILSR
jgi:hypothetical protein